MDIIAFVTQLAGATMLLLFSVRLVRTGIERAHGASFQRLMGEQTSLVGAGALGVALAVVLQSSAAVALLSGGFLASSVLGFPVALAIILGGDFGSALVVQILSFSVEWVIAPLLALGGWLSVKSENRRARQYGRVIMGVALILMALGLLRQAVAPVRDSSFLPFIAAYLQADMVTTFIVGGVLAFVMHSSVATILIIATLVHAGALPGSVGLPMLIGANFGAGFIPVWLTRGMPHEARRLVLVNMVLRGALALVVLLALIVIGDHAAFVAITTAPKLILCHVAFNFALLILALPFCRKIEVFANWALPTPSQPEDLTEALQSHVSALDPSIVDRPKLALTGLKQELLHMLGQVEGMFRPTIEHFCTDDDEKRQAVRDMDQGVNDALADIRAFVASIPKRHYTKAEMRQARDMLEYAIRLESAGDVVARRFTVLAGDYHDTGHELSADGLAELTRMYEDIMAHFKLAANVLLSNDPESARLLSLEKTEIKRLERQSRKRHLKRLQNGMSNSLETSDIHLECLRAMREFNGHISAVAYPILYQTGQLLETRLIEDYPNQLAEQS